jgi:NAD(P)-dependent dehydrogenase (short-subunit alcohol dehydrogenase family)
VFTSRNPERGARALTEIRAASGSDEVELLPLDLASSASIRACADTFLRQHDALHVLINNAGLSVFSGRQETADGFEMMFGVNHLGHFLLTNLLLDRIRASAPARIINLSSAGYRMAPDGLCFDDLQSEKAYSGFAVYGHSKLANIYFTRELARRLAGSGVSVNAVHPGYVQTELGKLRPEDREQLARAGADRAQSEPKPDLSHLPPPISPEEGAQTSIYLAMSDEVEDVSGEYFYRCEREQLKPVALDESAARRLWQVSEQLVARTGR